MSRNMILVIATTVFCRCTSPTAPSSIKTDSTGSLISAAAALSGAPGKDQSAVEERVRALVSLDGTEEIIAGVWSTERAGSGIEVEAQYEEFVSPRIPRLSGSAFELSPDDWGQLLGMDVTTRGLVGETDSTEHVQALVAKPRPPSDLAIEENRQPVRVALHEATAAWRDDGKILVYVTARRVPELPPIEIGNIGGLTSFAEIRQHLDTYRTAHTRRESAAFAAALTLPSGCELIKPAESAVAATLLCDVDGLRRLAAAPSAEIAGVSVDARGRVTSMRGDDIRADTGAQLRQYLTRDNAGTLCHQSGGTRACQDGRSSARGGNEPIRVALIDPEGFYRAHELQSLLDEAGGLSRVVSRRYCDASGCTAETGNGGFVGDHGSQAMVPAFRHILQGQAPSYSLIAAQEDRTAGAYEAELLLYRVDSSVSAVVEAVLAASQPTSPPYSDGNADVIVLSLLAGDPDCDNADSEWPDMRDAVDLAQSRGVTLIISAGNATRSASDQCSVNNLALGEAAIVVGAMGDDQATPLNGRAATPMSAWNYDTQPLMGWHWTTLTNTTNCTDADGDGWCWRSAVGGAGLRVGGTIQSGARRRVDVVTPAGSELRERMTAAGVRDWVATSCCGTSMAAPLAASALTSFLDLVAANNYSVSRNPLLIQASLLLQADGTRGNENPGAGPTGNFSGLDPTWGAGRLKMRRFDSQGMFAPWSWGWRTDYIYANKNSATDSTWFVAVNGPFSSAADEFAVALVWDEPFVVPSDTTKNAADIVVEVWTKPPVSGVCPQPTTESGMTLRAFDNSYDTHKLIRIQNATSLHGQCVWTRIRSWGMSSSGGFARRLVATTTLFEDRNAAGDIE